MATALAELLQRHVDAGTIPGAVGLIDHGEGDVETVAVGSASIAGAPLSTDAVFRIQSMTKAVTASAALRMVQQGRIGLDDSIEPWIPELANRRVLTSPDAELGDTVAAQHPITLRHLLTNTSGYGSIMVDSPLARAMIANGTDAGPEPVAVGADEWIARLSDLPLAFKPGEGWRYHHSFGILGVLLSRMVERPLEDHLRDTFFSPVGMVDTGSWARRADSLPAVYRRVDDALVEVEPIGGGFYAQQPPYDVSHAELVSTAADYHRFLRALLHGEVVAPELRALMVADVVPAHAKTPESFFPGFWSDMGWGFGVGVQTGGDHPGRWGWSGGLGTHFFVDPDGTIAILLTQVEIDARVRGLMEEFVEAADEGVR